MSPTSPIENLLDLNPHGRGLISSIYAIITSIDPQNLDYIRKAWQNDLGREFTDVEWEDAFKSGAFLLALCEAWLSSI